MLLEQPRPLTRKQFEKYKEVYLSCGFILKMTYDEYLYDVSKNQ